MLAAAAGLAGSCRAEAEGRITLEQAYDRALQTDQAIRIAYFEVRKANLLPWGALTKVTPRLSAGTKFTKTRINTTDTVDNFGNAFPPRRTGAGRLDLTFTQTLIDLSVFPAYRLGKLS